MMAHVGLSSPVDVSADFTASCNRRKKKGGQKWRSSLFSITPIEYNLNRMQTTGVKSLSPVHFEKLLHTPPENTARLNANHTPLLVILEYFSVETH